MKTKLAIIILLVNCMTALIIWVCMTAAISAGGRIRLMNTEAEIASASRMGTKGDKVAEISVGKDVLGDKKKFNSAFKTLKEKYQKITAADPQAYLKMPEPEFFKSFIDYFFISRTLSGGGVVLDDATVKEFLDGGIRLYSVRHEYPFLKKSIYLDKKHKTFNKPAVTPGTNIIVIFMESLSQFFLRDDIYGVHGLTSNIKDMRKRSFSFTNMYNSSFPTVKGLIAALGSSIYLLDENVGGSRIPIPCRFLFLSDILKSKNYSTNHFQAGSEHFISMKTVFMKRQSYDAFFGSESLALENPERTIKGFGVDDAALFSHTVEWLDKYSSPKPFLLTISTINMHPPFKAPDRSPAAGDNNLLNSLYSADKAFGIFWEYFKKSRFRNNTLVILTADHAMGNNKDYVEFIKDHKTHARPFFDLIPCFFYLPGGAWAGRTNDTQCASLDLLPTLLDMMNVDLENPFMGLSIFSERPYYKGMKNSTTEFKFDYNDKQLQKAKKILGFYFQTYRTDRILPQDYKVKFN